MEEMPQDTQSWWKGRFAGQQQWPACLLYAKRPVLPLGHPGSDMLSKEQRRSLHLSRLT